jgi:hypothetical protein
MDTSSRDFHFNMEGATRNMLPSLLFLCTCCFVVSGRGSGGFTPPFYPVANQISFSPLHRGYFTSNQMRAQSNLQGKTFFYS